MRRWAWPVVLGAYWLLGTPAAARDGVAPEAAALIEAGKAGRIREAAEGFGRLLAKAIKTGNLAEQMALQDALEDALAAQTRGSGVTQYQNYTTALDALLTHLAEVDTAHPLPHGCALDRCYAATHLGNTEGLDVAVKILDRQGRAFGKAEFPQLAKKYAEGLAQLAGGKPSQAATTLRGPWILGKRSGMDLLACHAGIECVAATVAADAGAGEGVLDEFGGWYFDPSRSALRSASNGWITQRMQALPGDLPGYWQGLVEAAPSVGGMAGAPGGAGGNAVRPGARTRVAEVLDRAKRSTVLAEVTHEEGDFEIRFPFERAYRLRADPNKGVGVDHKAEFGITLAIGRTGVRLAMLDLVGNKGQPGGSSLPKPFQPLFELAPGETWTLKADGSVTIK
ncbi:MAG: hypothetical protein KDB73_05135 [Planctomycetes bacterium]|nr:hypothetical protein [Planctomycetota bacterium]